MRRQVHTQSSLPRRTGDEDNWLANRVSHLTRIKVSYCRAAGGRLINQPWQVMTVEAADGYPQKMVDLFNGDVSCRIISDF